MKKLLVFGLFVAAGSQVLASFEMALVLDRGTKKVHRFDAASGAYLGSFGSFSAGVASLAINQTKGEAMIWDPSASSGAGGTCFYYNYNTGQLIGASTNWNSAIAVMGYSPDFASQRLSLGSQVFRTSFVRGAIADTSYFVGGNAGRFTTSGVTGLTVIRSGNIVEHYNDLTGAVAGTNATTAFTANDISFSGITTPQGTVGALALANGQLQHYYLTGSGILMSGSPTSGQFATATGVSNLHGGFIAVGKAASGAALVQSYAFASGGGVSSSRLVPLIGFTGGGMTDPVDVATVVAPEPLSITAIGLGMGLLVRRRRTHTTQQ